MSSQLDLDQGGTYRQWNRIYLGPSVGWIYAPVRNVLPVTTAGITTALIGVSLITVNVNGAVTIVLPSAVDPVVPPIALPGPIAKTPITIVDIGGFANIHNIVIQPAVGENIMGLSSIAIIASYGGYILQPNSPSMGWTNAQ